MATGQTRFELFVQEQIRKGKCSPPPKVDPCIEEYKGKLRFSLRTNTVPIVLEMFKEYLQAREMVVNRVEDPFKSFNLMDLEKFLRCSLEKILLQSVDVKE